MKRILFFLLLIMLIIFRFATDINYIEPRVDRDYNMEIVLKILRLKYLELILSLQSKTPMVEFLIYLTEDIRALFILMILKDMTTITLLNLMQTA